jgi:hypothetical protein
MGFVAAAAGTGSRHQVTPAEGEIPGEAADTALDAEGGSAAGMIHGEQTGASSGKKPDNIVGETVGAGRVPEQVAGAAPERVTETAREQVTETGTEQVTGAGREQ